MSGSQRDILRLAESVMSLYRYFVGEFFSLEKRHD